MIVKWSFLISRRPEIIKLLERYPDPKEEPEYISKFTELLRQQVNFDQQFNFNAQGT